MKISFNYVFFLNQMFSLVPVFKAVTQSALFELRLFEVVYDRFLGIYIPAVCLHVDSEVLNASDCLLPSKRLL